MTKLKLINITLTETKIIRNKYMVISILRYSAMGHIYVESLLNSKCQQYALSDVGAQYLHSQSLTVIKS